MAVLAMDDLTEDATAVNVTGVVLTGAMTTVEQDPVLESVAAAHRAVAQLAGLDAPADRLDAHAERGRGLLDGQLLVVTVVVLTAVELAPVGDLGRVHGRDYVGSVVRAPSERPGWRCGMLASGGRTMELTAAERQALEWLRDEDPRFDQVDRGVRDGLLQRGLVLTSSTGIAGAPGDWRWRITDPGRAALAAGA